MTSNDRDHLALAMIGLDAKGHEIDRLRTQVAELEAKLAAARSALAAVRDVRQAQIEKDGR